MRTRTSQCADDRGADDRGADDRGADDGGADDGGADDGSADDKRVDGGFTLLELMVVMTIIGLVVFALQGSRFAGGGGLALDHAARTMTDGLLRLRNDAMLHHKDALFVVDVEGRRFSAGEGADMTTLDPGIGLKLTAAREESPNGSFGGIRFFPDGSSTGGRVALTLGDLKSVIEVDWLTGMVSVIDHAD